MIVVDTSAWVEYLRATGSATHRQLRGLIERDAELATTDVVVMEILAGARSARRLEELRRFLTRFAHLPTEGLGDYERAAALCRLCRSEGETVRSLTDCLVAAVAIRTRSSVLARDRDFETIARHADLSVEEKAGTDSF